MEIGEPALSVTGEEGLGQVPLADLRETQAKLEAALAEAASLRVMLALRSHQYDEAWQAEQRGAAERRSAQAAAEARAAEREASRARETAAARAQEKARTDAVRDEAVARADARTEAVLTVLGAVLASLRVWGLNRRRFQRLVIQAGRDAPHEGPGAERHAVLLAEARRVLGRAG